MKTVAQKTILLILVLLSFSSCNMGLDELPFSDKCEISSFNFEKRWLGKEERITSDQDGNVIKYWVDKVMFQAIPNKALDISNTNIDVAVPDTTDLKSVVGLATISVGATITPLEGSPKLGERADFSMPRKYRVTASDGISQKDWTIVVRKEK
ncbi:MAG: hypothetical protein RR382_06650 [Tannerellaceae bacterium]